jgi:dipeptidase E
MKHLIIASTSTMFGGNFLDYLTEEISVLFSDTDEILFIPYARPGGISHDEYTIIAARAFSKLNKNLVGVHTLSDPVSAIRQAKGVFVGGGNTFVLVSQLYKNNMMQELRKAVISGLPYLGTSAGSNICGLTINNTNDMPIVYPPSFKSLGIIPFNINPHYLDPDPSSKHMGETRETRINEFHTQNNIAVIGLREGTWLDVYGDTITLKGELSARLFQQGQTPIEIESSTNLNTLID